MSFHCPLCAADVEFVVWHTGYCDDCAQASDERAAKRDTVLAEKRAERDAAVVAACAINVANKAAAR